MLDRSFVKRLSASVVLSCFLIAAHCSSAGAGVLGQWQFGDGSGATASDSSGNAYHGTLSDFADTSAGGGEYEGGSGWASGGRLNFDGRSLENAGTDTVRTDLPIAAMSGGSFTVEAVVSHNWQGQNWSPFFGQSDTVCCPHIFFFGKRDGQDQLHHNISGLGTGDSVAVPITDGDPHHIALVFDDNADTIDVYFDHTNVQTRTGVTGTLDTFSPNTLWLGGVGHSAAERWNGYASEARITVDNVPGDGTGALTPAGFLPVPPPNPAPGPLGSSFSFADFSNMSTFRARGAAGPFADRLRLTSRTEGGQAGGAFLNGTVQFQPDLSFNTNFAFEISEPNTGFTDGQDGAPDRAGADGFTFVIQNAAPAALGGAGGSIGLEGLGGDYVAVEFDTWPGGVHDAPPNTNGNHIAIDLSGVQFSVAETPDDPAPGAIPRFNDGGVFYAWVDYDGQTDVMDVFFSDTASKPGTPTLSASGIDLESHFGGATDLYVGFTAGTGGAVNNHDIVSWQFQTGWIIPEPTTLALVGMGLIGLVRYGRRRKR